MSKSTDIAAIRDMIDRGLSNDEISKVITEAAARANRRGAIFKKDGTLNGLSYLKASPPRRGAALSLSIGRKLGEKCGLANSFMLDGYDFFEVYSKAVDLLAEYHGVTQDQNIVDDMRATASVFLAAKGLATKRIEVVYQQVFPASQDTI